MPRVTRVIILGAMSWLVLIGISPVHAAWLQFSVDTGHIMGAFHQTEDMRLGPGEAAIEWMPGVAPTDLVWPTPPSCAQGRLEWAILGPGNTVPPIVEPTLVFYRCHVVTNKRSTYYAVSLEIAVASVQYRGDGSDIIMLLVGEMYRRCPVGDNSANCPEIRGGADVIAQLLRGKGQLRTLAEFGAAAKTEADALIQVQGW